MDETAATIKTDVELDGRPHHVIEVSVDVQPVDVFIDAASGRLSKLQTLQNDSIWGDVITEVTYSDWSAPEGSRVMFPHQVELAVHGKTLRTARRTSLVVNPDFPAEAFAVPDDPRTEVDPSAAERGGMSSQYVTRWHAIGLPLGDQDQTSVVATAVAGDPDVQHLTGGSHHSLAIKLGEGIVVVEPPLNEARSRAVLDKLDELWPGVAVSHLILTHHHFDHMGGIRTYAAVGATIVTSEFNRSYVEEALASSHTLVPDELAKVASPEWRIEAVPADGEFSLGGHGRSVKARHIPTIHSEDMLVIYLPELRLLFVSDIYQPGFFPPQQPLPAPFGDWTQGLRDGLAKREWNIEWLAGGHGGIAPFTDLASHFEN
jgi:glyoxylase-like metal-dependent hydrolase (beta-lactamase superfamily II)